MFFLMYTEKLVGRNSDRKTGSDQEAIAIGEQWGSEYGKHLAIGGNCEK